MSVKIIDCSNEHYKNARHDYIKNLCSGRNDALHCNYFKWGRAGVGCPCILPEARQIKDGEEFTVIEPEV